MRQKLAVILILLILLTACSADGFRWDHPIHVVSREDGSGTRSSFTSLSGITASNEQGEPYDNTTIEAVITNSTSVVMVTISGDPHAIGYLSLGSLNNSVKSFEIDGVLPTIENIQAGNYPLSRPFLIVTNGTLNPLGEDFIAYILSDRGQSIVAQYGYIPNQMALPYQTKDLSGKIVVGGSSSVSPVMEKLKETYAELYPHITVEIQQSDSTTGIASVASGTYDIGMSSRVLKDSETAPATRVETIATDGIVVVANKQNPIDSLQLEDVQKIFTGEYTSWRSLERGEA